MGKGTLHAIKYTTGWTRSMNKQQARCDFFKIKHSKSLPNKNQITNRNTIEERHYSRIKKHMQLTKHYKEPHGFNSFKLKSSAKNHAKRVGIFIDQLLASKQFYQTSNFAAIRATLPTTGSAINNWIHPHNHQPLYRCHRRTPTQWDELSSIAAMMTNTGPAMANSAHQSFFQAKIPTL